MTGVEVPDVMRAAVLFGPNDLRIVSKPVPRPARDEVLVWVAMCGACGTDVAIQSEPFPGQPPFGSFTPGHEWTARWSGAVPASTRSTSETVLRSTFITDAGGAETA
jgi:hypothetical protein